MDISPTLMLTPEGSSSVDMKQIDSSQYDHNDAICLLRHKECRIHTTPVLTSSMIFVINISFAFPPNCCHFSFVATNLQMNINKHGIVVKCKLIWHVDWDLVSNWNARDDIYVHDDDQYKLQSVDASNTVKPTPIEKHFPRQRNSSSYYL